MLRRMISMLILAGLLFGGIFGYQWFTASKMKASMQSAGTPPQTVSAMKVPYETWQPKMQFVATLNTLQGVNVTTEAAGLITKILFESGAEVKKGDILVELNADTEIAHLHVLEAAADLAQITYERDTAQYAVNAISKATLDTDAADLKGKKAQVDAQASLVAKKIIRAPFSGRTGIMNINEGQYLNPGDNITPLQLLDPILANFSVPQQFIDKLNLGQPVFITVDSYPGQVFKGKVTTIEPIVNADTRTVQIQATLPNPEHKLLPEMYAFLEVETGEPQKYLTLPQTAISHNAYGDVAYIIRTEEKQGKEQLKAEQTFVTLGETRGDQVAILKGLKENDLVVTAGQLKLKNGTPVVIDNTVTPPNDPDPVVLNETY